MKSLTIAEVNIRQDAQYRHCLNDLHKAAVAQGANARTKEPGKFLSSPRAQELVRLLEQESATQNLGSTHANSVESATPIWRSTFSPISTVENGPYDQRGTFVCIELVIAYGQFVSAAFDLKVIRTFLDVLDGHTLPHVQNIKFWDRLRSHWAGIARLALTGLKNKAIAAEVGRSAGSVGRCLRRMYEVGYLNPVAVFQARLKPATAQRWALEKPMAATWGKPAPQQALLDFIGEQP